MYVFVNIILKELIAFISVSTNAAILCFTMNVLHVEGPTTVWLFIAFQYFVFMIMFVSERIVDDVPLEVWRAHSVIIYFRFWKYCF